jgi:hypothetical protein
MNYTLVVKPPFVATLTKEQQVRLRNNDKRLVNGESDVLIAPPFDNVSDSTLKDFVDDMLNELTLPPVMVDIEKANLKKMGPRSIAKPWDERRDDLLKTFKDERPISFEAFETICVEYRSYFRKEPNYRRYINLTPYSRKLVESKMVKSTSAGLPYMTKKRNVLRDFKDYFETVGAYPTVTYTRTQEGGKTRNVNGYGIADVVRELRYQMPFLVIEKQLPWRAAIVSPEAVDKAVTQILMTKRDDQVIYCADFTQYDASVTAAWAGRAFAFIAAHFVASELKELYDIYVRFVTIPFYTPDGEYRGTHGVPSGSAFTNTIDSIVQYLILIDALGLSYLESLEVLLSQVQGDDGVYLLHLDQIKLVEDAFERAGLDLNKEKSDQFSDAQATFLQRYYNLDYLKGNVVGGIYSVARDLLRLKYMESYISDIGGEDQMTGDDYFASRIIAILENCKHHPYFRQLVKYVQRLDRHSLNVTDLTLKRFQERDDRRARTGITNQYGDEEGLASFATVKILREVA